MTINNILITGCSGGLGRAIAIRLSQAGLQVYAVSRNKEALKKLTDTSSLITPISADITTRHGRHVIAEHINNKNNAISIIHNAGIAVPELFNSLSEDNLRNHFETNYFAPMLITHQLLPFITKGQRILHISSGAASIALPGLMPYCTSKAALQHSTLCLNAELNAQGVFCANVRPGMVDTPLQTRLRNTSKEALPNNEAYLSAQKENKLINAEVAAEFISWVLLKTDDSLYSQTPWNIYDSNHHQNWMRPEWQQPIR